MILRLALLAYLILLALAMYNYPGGTQWDSNTVGYLFDQNFLSDLGNSKAWSGADNQLSQSLVIIAHIILALGFLPVVKKLRAKYRRLSDAVFGMALGLILLILFPYSEGPLFHHISSGLFLCFSALSICYSFQIYPSGLNRSIRTLFVGLAIISAVFLLIWADKSMLVVPQKALLFTLALWIWGLPQLCEASMRLTPKPPSQTKRMSTNNAFAYDLWYMAMASCDLKRGEMKQKCILSQNIVFARAHDGEIIAMADRCPHRGMPLSFGNFDGKEIECAYHGWCFNKQGTCTKIPALTEHDKVDISKISSSTYFTEERNGIIFVFMPEDVSKAPNEKPPFMDMPYDDFEGEFFKIDNPRLPCDIDNANFGLLDPAHVPFVHKSWWWRPSRERKMKEKSFRPWGLGFQMIAHTPSANSKGLKAVGGKLETEITFQLPGYRIECIRGGDKETVALTALTPINETEVEFTQFLKFPKGHYLNMFKWVLRYLGRGFMAQDVDAFTKQAQGNRDTDKMMYVGEVDQQGKWYFQVKKAYQEAQQNDNEFENPVEEATLHWYT